MPVSKEDGSAPTRSVSYAGIALDLSNTINTNTNNRLSLPPTNLTKRFTNNNTNLRLNIEAANNFESLRASKSTLDLSSLPRNSNIRNAGSSGGRGEGGSKSDAEEERSAVNKKSGGGGGPLLSFKRFSRKISSNNNNNIKEPSPGVAPVLPEPTSPAVVGVTKRKISKLKSNNTSPTTDQQVIQ